MVHIEPFRFFWRIGRPGTARMGVKRQFFYQAVRIDHELLRRALVEVAVSLRTSSSEMTVAFAALAIWILSCQMAIARNRAGVF